VPKRHLDFENPIINNKPYDDTKGRIYGELMQPSFSTETGKIGTSSNPADSLAKTGLKTLSTEQQVSIETIIE